MSQSAVLDPWRRPRPGSRRERSALGRVRPRARTAAATHPGPRTKPGTPAAEHRGFVGEVESCGHEAPGLGCKALSFARKAKSLAKKGLRKALSFARKVKSLAHAPKRFVRKAPGLPRKVKSLAHGPKSLAAKAPRLVREVPQPHCRAKSPAREAPGLGREARRAGAEAEGLEAGARGLGREAWRPGEPDRRKAGDAARPPAPSPRPVRRDGTRCNEPLKFLPFTLRSLPKDSDDGAVENRLRACASAPTLDISVPCAPRACTS